MDMTGDRRIPASREAVWAALNDPAVLKACIPGCEKLERTPEGDLVATAGIKIGPIAAKFSGRLQLLDLDPPNSYRIAGEGQGGVAGFAKGGATVNLTEEGEQTLMRYDVRAQVGGKIAQLGARLIDATAKQMADAFFNRFVAEVGATPPDTVGADGPAGLVAAATEPARPAAPGLPAKVSLLSMIPTELFGFPLIAWIAAVVFLAIFALIFISPLL